MSEDQVLAVLIAEARAIGIADDATAMQRMQQAANKAAIELQSCATTEVNLPFLGVTREGPVHLLVRLPQSNGPLLDPRVKLS